MDGNKYPKLMVRDKSINNNDENNSCDVSKLTFRPHRPVLKIKTVSLIDILTKDADYLDDEYMIDCLYLTKDHIPALKCYLMNLDNEIASLGLDKNNSDDKMRILCYLYSKLQREIKYYHPKEIVGSYKDLEKENELGLYKCRTPYGGLIEHYATCEGIANTMNLLCDYYDISCKYVHLQHGDICGHGVNQVRFDNSQVLYFDLAGEIGMELDGRKHNIEKKDITYDKFLVGAGEFSEYTGFPSDAVEFDFSAYRESLFQDVSKLCSNEDSSYTSKGLK